MRDEVMSILLGLFVVSFMLFCACSLLWLGWTSVVPLLWGSGPTAFTQPSFMMFTAVWFVIAAAVCYYRSRP